MRCRAILILAGGASTRLGQPKQLVVWDGETLLARCTRLAISSQAGRVAVVLGAHAEQCLQVLAPWPAAVIFNPQWREGIASSIRRGVQALAGKAEGILILPCDQPGITTALLNQLLDTEADIAACEYAGTRGAPCYFSRQFFPELQALRGDAGARHLLARHTDLVRSILFPAGAFDIDTPGNLPSGDKSYIHSMEQFR